MKTTLTITTLFLLSLAGQAQVPIRDTTGQRGTLLINNSRAKTAVGASAAILPAEQALQVPEPARQYLLRSQQQFQTVPVCDYAGPLQTIAVVNAPFTQDRLTKAQRIKLSYGGQHPYTVVLSREPFVIINESNDLLIIGEPAAEAIILDPRDLPSQQNCYFPRRTSNAPIHVVEAGTRLNAQFVPPPGVPTNVVEKQDVFGPNSEPVWNPNLKVVYPTALKANNHSGDYRVYRFREN